MQLFEGQTKKHLSHLSITYIYTNCFHACRPLILEYKPIRQREPVVGEVVSVYYLRV